ncbi:TauD/TfdA dioxygenase family protein [Pseudomonas typographi]|uniref:TauD/TfdA family dioxygenase n=1 Tax=Pseudomonas typographi TaxID=2715964 RepID=A0ABR7Z1L3_9PSED|nr:TauD/TfdA family dioxygenase [Pseudomonas typographi]MBD1551486.1 TauD/TfdA family dioxygenase [Pseudomonas typographi]MBD1599389.1 TauD/TfdA family dioxygenase [Pseudomonas typographi]
MTLLAVAPPLDARPLTVRTGAEIHGVRLAGDLPDSTVAAIRQALLKHKVIFFRGQGHLDEAAHEAFARRLGPLQPHPARAAVQGTQATLNLDSRDTRSSTWHADLTFLNAFPALSVLRGVEIPALGGDTLWANTASAYEHLPGPFKAFVDSLWAVHSNVYDSSALIPAGSTTAAEFHAQLSKKRVIETEHPVVHVHPETGERSLLLGHFVKRLVGFNSPDSARLLAILQDHAVAHENIVRWRWQPGDVAIWDNRATLHKAVDDYNDAPRIVRRVTVSGTFATAVDGATSVTRQSADSAGVA